LTVEVSLIATLPEHQRKGAGIMLMNWVCARADELGLPAMLEATDAGRPLYERYGFVPVKEHVYDLAPYGLEGTDRFTAMIREPVKKD
jgi:GNAT superfamily N-acetyltransferase